MQNIEEPDRTQIFSRQVTDFLTVAAEFCRLLEKSEDIPFIHFIEITHRILPLLYIKGCLLPDVELIADTTGEGRITEEGYEKMYAALQQKFNKHGNFWETSNPISEINEDIVKADIPELLTDIYQDMKDFTQIYQAGSAEEKQNIIFECKMQHEEQWGRKSVGLIRALHYLIYFKPDIRKARKPDITDIA
ncbi:MAG: DUF5063 domain-containing protein [Bacteroidetes bacterium]|nr:DUF5063 domain-containing protein [Bacteroidota bacterium]MBU1719696.1 DUF5063 domain-containing protein [Bacteroidota bacterium]